MEIARRMTTPTQTARRPRWAAPGGPCTAPRTAVALATVSIVPGRRMTWMMTMVMLAVLSIVSLLPQGARGGCECGFVMDDTRDYFTHAIYNNFSLYAPAGGGGGGGGGVARKGKKGKKASAHRDFARDWEVQRWGREPKNWASPLGIMNRDENLFIKDGLLNLRQEAYTRKDVLYGKNVSVASMSSVRKDIVHGSFRVDMRLVNATGGSVVGFFWYKDDENEIDIEVLSREFKSDQMMVHYTTHPALDDKGNVIKNATEIITIQGDHPADHFQRHRFDWTPRELRFYNDFRLVHTNVARIPTEAGQVHLNLWADGGPWSGSPSTSNVYLLVKSIAIYHNTTTSEAGKDAAFNKRCTKAGGPSAKTVCLDTMVERGLHKQPQKGGIAPSPPTQWQSGAPQPPPPPSQQNRKSEAAAVVTRPVTMTTTKTSLVFVGMACLIGGILAVVPF